jgi:hypothetical protein
MGRATVLELACLALIGCASSGPPAAGSVGAASADKALTGCARVAARDGAVRYACRGFSAVAADEPAERAGDPDGEVEELVAGIVDEFQPMREKLGARVRVETSILEVEGREAHAAKVSADDPTHAGRYFAAGYVIVSGKRRLVCTTQAGDGTETCEPAMRALLDRPQR